MDNLDLINEVISQEIDPAFASRSLYIVNELVKKKPKRILDAGCGRGFYLKLFSLLDFPQEIIGVDVEDKYLEKAKKFLAEDKRIKVKKASLYRLPFRDEYFDFIVCSEVLEHLKDDVKAVSELHRVLKKGGTLIVTVPNKNFPFLWDPLNWILMRLFKTHVNKNIWWLAGIWADHERLYTEDEIKNLIRKKFNIRQIRKIIYWCWPFTHFIIYGVGKNIVEKAGFTEFNRFKFSSEKRIGNVLASFFSLPSRVLDKRFPHESSMNLLITAKKEL